MISNEVINPIDCVANEYKEASMPEEVKKSKKKAHIDVLTDTVMYIINNLLVRHGLKGGPILEELVIKLREYQK